MEPDSAGEREAVKTLEAQLVKRLGWILGMLAALLFATASVALADTSSGYLTPSGSPHGGYITTSKHCGACHAVHKATSGGVSLMRGTAANACTFCHITTATGLIRLYDGVEANYTVDNKKEHNPNGGRCVRCHTPHAATARMTGHAYLDDKILKYSTAISATTSFQSTPTAGDGVDLAVTRWCTACHKYYNLAYDGQQHIMGSANANYANPSGTTTVKVAWTNSEYCTRCHDAGLRNQADGTVKVVTNSFPHYTVGQRFLLSAANDNGSGTLQAPDSTDDGVCLKCHRDGVGVAGIGISY